MPDHYEKTALGRAEIASRAAQLPRTTRNLLVVIDGSRPAAQWLDMIAGAGPADLEDLLARGLIALSARQPSAASGGGRQASIDDLLQGMNREALYKLLTGQAKRQLGLLSGLRMVLEVEKCGTEAELRDLARRFVSQVRETKGDGAVRDMLRSAG